MEARCVLVCFLMVVTYLDVQGQTIYKEISLIGHACGMSSRYYDSIALAFSNCTGAINGNISRYLLITRQLQNCIHTSGSSDPSPVWWVDMGGNYTVYFIRIFARDGQTNRTKYLTVAIDHYMVYQTFDTVPQTKNQGNGIYFDIFNIPTLPYTGRNLTISRNDPTAEYWDKNLNFCEVQVWECANDYYGSTCERCGHCAGGSPCNKQNGNCNSCSPGYHSPTCTASCGEGCQNGVCQQDGTCSCKAGWATPYCTTPCQHGYYGQDCTSPCGVGCNQNRQCNSVNGTCTCRPGWMIDKCTECTVGYYGPSCAACGAGCQGGTCQDDGQCVCKSGWMPGYCTTPCPRGRYGQNCTSVCGAGCHENKCDAVSGACNCSSNRWMGPKCAECSVGNYGIYADGNPRPKDCVTCGQGCEVHPCDVTSGNCTCLPGWQAPRCDSNCTVGRYGQDCGSKCAAGCQGGDCDYQTGNCTCMEHWKQPHCDACNVSYWGPDNCSVPCENCGGDGSCNMTNGHCLSGCSDGWSGAACVQKLESAADSDNVNVGGVTGGVVAAVIIIAIGVVVGVILFKRRRQNKRREGTDVRSGHNSRTDRIDHIPITSSISHEATVAVNKKEKPKLPVKPMRRDEAGVDETTRLPLYGNIAQASSTSEPDRSNTRLPVLSPKSGATRSAGNVYENISSSLQSQQPAESSAHTSHDRARSRRAVKSAGDADDLSEVLADDEDDVYNTEDLYAVYKNTRPQVDALQQYLIDALASGELSGQFKKFAKGMKLPHKDGMTDENVIKNRFKAMCAYDFNRVHLRRPKGDPESDYINASYIKGCRRDRQYIATQGPRDNTVNDLWWMVWQEKVTQMVMLTNIQEDGKDKCKEYWPVSGKTQKYGHVTVRALEVQERSDYVIRPFLLKTEGKSAERQVIQYHYNTWPDHGVPQAAALVDFWRYVKARGDATVPLLVHCSAGVGRTGTFIALDIASEREGLGLEVNVKDIVTELREQRCIMVQSEAQYKFLHEVILEAHTSRDTRIPVDKFEEVFPDVISVDKPDQRIDGEFKMLQEMGKHAPKPKHTMAEMEENRNKNRNQDVLPDDKHLVYLTVHVRGRNQYINAVYMSNFQHRRGLLLTQLPIPSNTMMDFWRMVDGCDVKTVVSLGSGHERDSTNGFCQYWPLTDGEVLNSGPYSITMASLNKMSGHLTSYRLTALNKNDNKERPVQLFHYKAWAGELPDDTASLLQLVHTIKERAEDDVTSPIVIQCIDGAAKSGLFCAVYDIINRVTYDAEVDVYLTARHVQTVRPQAVATETQYRFLYKTAQEYIRYLNVYQNASVS